MRKIVLDKDIERLSLMQPFLFSRSQWKLLQNFPEITTEFLFPRKIHKVLWKLVKVFQGLYMVRWVVVFGKYCKHIDVVYTYYTECRLNQSISTLIITLTCFFQPEDHDLSQSILQIMERDWNIDEHIKNKNCDKNI